MRYLAIITVANANLPGSLNLYHGSTTSQNVFESVERAKASIEGAVNGTLKQYMQNGYTAYIIDKEAQQIVATASMPVPTLKWNDSPGSSKK